jgi:cell division protein FtsB
MTKQIVIDWTLVRRIGIVAVLLTVSLLYIFKTVEYNKEVLVHEAVYESYEDQIESLKKRIEIKDSEIKVLKEELVESDEELDSMSRIVDVVEPQMIEKIEYITQVENYTDEEYESSKDNIINGIKAMSAERKLLFKSIASRDVIIKAQSIQIKNLNQQIDLLDKGNEQLVLANKSLKKQLRKEVRKRRLTTLAGIGAVVGVIFITSR